jgi:hypothetical protein
MKPYLLVLAAFVFISSLLLVPDVYAQFSGGATGMGCDGSEKSDAGKGRIGQPPGMMGREHTQIGLN